MTGTPLFFAPEIIRGNSHSFKADVWSLGVVFYQMLAKKYPFYDQNFPGLLTKILENEASPLPSIYSKNLCAFVMEFLIKDEKERPTIQQICTSDFFVKTLDIFPGEKMKNLNFLPQTKIRITENFLQKEFELIRIFRFSENQSTDNSSLEFGSNRGSFFDIFHSNLSRKEQNRKRDKLLSKFANQVEVSEYIDLDDSALSLSSSNCEKEKERNQLKKSTKSSEKTIFNTYMKCFPKIKSKNNLIQCRFCTGKSKIVSGEKYSKASIRGISKIIPMISRLKRVSQDKSKSSANKLSDFENQIKHLRNNSTHSSKPFDKNKFKFCKTNKKSQCFPFFEKEKGFQSKFNSDTLEIKRAKIEQTIKKASTSFCKLNSIFKGISKHLNLKSTTQNSFQKTQTNIYENKCFKSPMKKNSSFVCKRFSFQSIFSNEKKKSMKNREHQNSMNNSKQNTSLVRSISNLDEYLIFQADDFILNQKST